MEKYGKIDKRVIEHICEIAKLTLDEDEKEMYAKELNSVLEAFKQMEEVDVSGIEPSFHPYKVENVWREDVVKKTDWDPLYNTKHKEKGLFKGPSIV